MPFNINTFRAAFKFGGARTALFRIRLTNPIVPSADSQLTMMATASNFPSWQVSPIQVWHYGRSINVAGNRQFDGAWDVTVINDEDFKIRDSLETWSNAINSLEGNIRTTGGSEPALYKSSGEIIQMSQTGQDLRTYKFSGIFPTAIGGMGADWSSNSVQSYQVTFAYDYFYIENGTTGNAGGR